MNTAGCQILRELFGKTRSSLDTDWLAIGQAKAAHLCHRPPAKRRLMTANLSAYPTHNARR